MTRALLLLALCLVAAAPAAAGTVTIGSDLSADATVAVSNPNDWGAWNTTLAGGGQVTVPAGAQGELSVVRLKGSVDRTPGAAVPDGFVVLFQVLRPQGDGRVQTMVTTQPMELPSGGITTYRLQQFPARMCVKPGDYISIATSGGFQPSAYPQGVPMQVFGRVPGSVANIFRGDSGGANGDGKVYRGTASTGVELLLQADIATGTDARPFCQAPAPDPDPDPGPDPDPAEVTLRVAEPPRNPRVRRGRFTLRLACSAATACDGSVRITRGRKTLGSVRTSVPAGATAPVRLALNRRGKRLFRRKGSSLNVTVTATSGGATDSRDIRIVK